MIDHRGGLQRAELFEDLLDHLLRREFRGRFHAVQRWMPLRVTSSKDRLLRETSIDFGIMTHSGEWILVEAKSPFTEDPAYGIRRTVRRLKDLARSFPPNTKELILALAAPVPDSVEPFIADARQFFSGWNITFTVWGAEHISTLCMRHFHVRPANFEVATLESILTNLKGTKVRARQRRPPDQQPSSQRTAVSSEGPREDVIVLCADFCSFSKFVHATSDNKLIVSIMSRFYRETRRIIESSGGAVEKYMGDGILAFWLTEGPKDGTVATRLDACVRELVGFALTLAKEWQERIDYAVKPVGMKFWRCYRGRSIHFGAARREAPVRGHRGMHKLGRKNAIEGRA